MTASALSDGIHVSVYARTDVGMRRQGNEDSFLVADLSTGRLGLGPEVTSHLLGNHGTLMIVSDGLGGAAAGEVASAMAVQTVCTELMKSTKSVLSANDRLKRATELANEQIWNCAQADSSLRGMGATLTAAFAHGNSIYIAQVGDSRAYIIRNGKVKQVTEDQSWANAVKKAGLEAADVPNNVILQALGTQPKVHVEVTSVELCNGDTLLLCSDGLSNKIKDDEMREIAGRDEELQDSCSVLVDMANKRGGEDNITVIIARFVSEALAMGLDSSPSITSTFKVVTPLDFNDGIDGTDTMSFRVEEPPQEDFGSNTMTQFPLPDSLPTLSDLPQIPALSAAEQGKANKLPLVTSPLTGEPLPIKALKESTPQKAAPEKSSEKLIEEKGQKPLSPPPFVPSPPKIEPKAADKDKKGDDSRRRAMAETKSDLPVVPIFDLKSEPIPLEAKKTEPEINIEFNPVPIQQPKISTPPVMATLPLAPPPPATLQPLSPAVKNEAPKGELSRTELPKAPPAPKLEPPKVAAPKVEPPPLLPTKPEAAKPELKVEPPKLEPPKAPPLKVEAPNVAAPKLEPPKAPVVKPEVPKFEAPAIQPARPEAAKTPAIVAPPIAPPIAPPMASKSIEVAKPAEKPKVPETKPMPATASIFSPPVAPPKAPSLAPAKPVAPPALTKPAVPAPSLPQASGEFPLFNTEPTSAPASVAPKGDAQDIFSASMPGLVIGEAFKDRPAAKQSKSIDDQPEPLMLETLSMVAPPEDGPNAPVNAPVKSKAEKPIPSSVPVTPPVPPPPVKPGASAKAAPPPLSPAKPTAPPMISPGAPPLIAPSAKAENKPASAGVEVLASLFSTPTNKSAGKTEPLKSEGAKPSPTAPQLVIPSGKTDALPATPPPLRGSAPPLVAPPPLAPPAGGAGAFTKGLPPLFENTSPLPKPMSPAKPEGGDVNLASLFAPPPAGAQKASAPLPPISKPAAPAVPPPPLKGAVPPIQPPPKADLKAPLPMPEIPAIPKPAAPPVAPPVQKAPPPVQKAPPIQAPPPVSAPPPIAAPPIKAPRTAEMPAIPAKTDAPAAKQDIPPMPAIKTEPPRSSSAPALNSSSSSYEKPESKLNPKLVMGGGGAIVVVLAVAIGLYSFSGPGTKQATNKTPAPLTSTAPSPVASASPNVDTPQPTQTPVNANPSPQPTAPPPPVEDVPKDTPALVKYALTKVSDTMDRVQRDMPEGDIKESYLRRLGAFKSQLGDYVSKNIGNDDARGYAESALSQLKGVVAQLDALPPSPAKGGKRR